MIRRFARPYARAIMDVAQTPEKAAALRDEMTVFEQVRKSSTDLQLMLLFVSDNLFRARLPK